MIAELKFRIIRKSAGRLGQERTFQVGGTACTKARGRRAHTILGDSMSPACHSLYRSGENLEPEREREVKELAAPGS